MSDSDLIVEANSEDEPLENFVGTTDDAISVARISDGSGYLIISGENAGRKVNEIDIETLGEVTPIPDRDVALNGSTPLFLIHRPYRYWREIPSLLARIHAFAGKNLALGYIAKMSQFSEDAHNEFAGLCGAGAVRIIDPEGFYANGGDLRLGAMSKGGRARSPHLDAEEHDAGVVLQMQRDRGANLLLSSGSALIPADPDQSLQDVFSQGDSALAELLPGERLALNITVSETWLSNTTLRDRLLNQLLDQEQFGTWYVRVQWHDVKSHTQPINSQLLQGYKQLCQLAVDENRALILPQTGLTGWLMLGFGATGFGTGISGSAQAFQEHQGGGGGGSEIERIFIPQILHTIERTSLAALSSNPSYSTCRCFYCHGQIGRPVWSHTLSNLHCVMAQARLAMSAGIAAGNRGGSQAEIRRIVRSAKVVASKSALTGISEPKHLQVWDQLI